VPRLREIGDGVGQGELHRRGSRREGRGVEEGEGMALRVKRMAKKEFEQINERQYIPVILAGKSIPKWMRGIPKEKVELVLAAVLSMSTNNQRKRRYFKWSCGGHRYLSL